MSNRVINLQYVEGNLGEYFEKIITTGLTYRRRILLCSFLAHKRKYNRNWKKKYDDKKFAPIRVIETTLPRTKNTINTVQFYYKKYILNCIIIIIILLALRHLMVVGSPIATHYD